MNFNHILFVGPQDEKGGIGAVLNTYRESMEGFRMLSTYPEDRQTNVYRFYFKQYLKLVKLLLFQEDIKILHIHSASNGSFVRKSFVLFMAKAFRKKVIMHIHGGKFREFYQASKLKTWCIGSILGICDRVICLTDEWKELFQKELRLKNLEVVLNPVKAFPMVPVSKQFNQISLLFMGTITENKGIFELVQYLKQNPYFLSGKLKLFICGEGDNKKLSQYLTEVNSIQHIIYAGWVDGERKCQLLQYADVFILPSHYEGLPMAILEAMTAGIPIISTRVGGIPTVVKPRHNGWLIEPKSIEALGPILEEIMDDPSIISRFGRNARKDAETFHVTGIVSQLTNIYNSLC